jgi:hypothetical protein
MNAPGPGEPVPIRETYELASMMSEIEVVATQRVFNPARHLEEQRSIDVVAEG